MFGFVEMGSSFALLTTYICIVICHVHRAAVSSWCPAFCSKRCPYWRLVLFVATDVLTGVGFGSFCSNWRLRQHNLCVWATSCLARCLCEFNVLLAAVRLALAWLLHRQICVRPCGPGHKSYPGKKPQTFGEAKGYETSGCNDDEDTQMRAHMRAHR